jgi:hypothetical protein
MSTHTYGRQWSGGGGGGESEGDEDEENKNDAWMLSQRSIFATKRLNCRSAPEN